MTYSICVIDDKIPVYEVEYIKADQLLNSSNLFYLLQQKEDLWEEPVVKNLIRTLLDEKEDDGKTKKWEVYGFENPSFYINKLNDGIFCSDIIILDWDYPGTNIVDRLMEMLERAFSLIFIFSGAELESEINRVLEQPQFIEYKGRFHYLDKSKLGNDQTGILIQKASEYYEKNFSFRFSNILRRNSLLTINSILSDLGKVMVNDIKNHVIFGETAKKDFVDFITEKFRSSLATEEIYDLVNKLPEPANDSSVDPELVKKVWSYRLYFHQDAGDNFIRCGDIVQNGVYYYFVLSTNCDLGHFWKKNFGMINVIPVYELNKSNTTLINHLAIPHKDNEIGKLKIKSSLLTPIEGLPEGPFILPYIECSGEYKSFLAIPKEVQSFSITNYPDGWAKMDNGIRGIQAIRYTNWDGAKKLCTLSEPFLTPTIQHVFNSISGYGVPDFDKVMKENLQKDLDLFCAKEDQ